MRALKEIILNFQPMLVTFDQHQSALPIQDLAAWAANVHLARTPTIREQTASHPRNRRTAAVFKGALRLGIVHSPQHDLARNELLYLQQHPNGTVDHPTFGPVQTSDVADCLFELTEQLIGQSLDASIGQVGLHASPKASSVALFRRDGAALRQLQDATPGFFAQLSRAVQEPILAGAGAPLILRGETVLGAFAVSGGMVPGQDDECAEAALAALAL